MLQVHIELSKTATEILFTLETKINDKMSTRKN